MKKSLIVSFLLVFVLTTASARSSIIDFHFGFGYGADILPEKEVFPTNHNLRGFVNIFDGFLGGGYKFLNLGMLSLSTGLEYQANYRLALMGQEGDNQLNLSGVAFGHSIDQYISAYFKTSWWITPVVPAGVMLTMGLGFREVFNFFILSVDNNNVDFTTLHPDKTLAVGYKMGLRAFLLAFYLEMDYTVFPTVYKSTNDTAQTLTLTGGFMFNL